MSPFDPGCVKTRRGRQTLQYSNQTRGEGERLLSIRSAQRINLAARPARGQFSHGLDPERTLRAATFTE